MRVSVSICARQCCFGTSQAHALRLSLALCSIMSLGFDDSQGDDSMWFLAEPEEEDGMCEWPLPPEEADDEGFVLPLSLAVPPQNSSGELPAAEHASVTASAAPAPDEPSASGRSARDLGSLTQLVHAPAVVEDKVGS